MKVAILYTGAIRTIRKTIHFLRSNVILNGDVHVFAAIQRDDDFEEYDSFIRAELGPSLKDIIWIDKGDPLWVATREFLLHEINVDDNWKMYLKTSGSMVEYYQMYMAYRAMLRYERSNGFEYDELARVRTDCVITRPLDFYWLSLSDEDIKATLSAVVEKTGDAHPGSKVNITKFMTSILYRDRIDVVPAVTRQIYNDSDPLLQQMQSCQDLNPLVKMLGHYLNHGKYIFTLRENVAYVVKRSNFRVIPALGVTYGMYTLPNHSQWFDAESQFKEICADTGLSVFDYCADIEVKSLYNYDERDYFDADGGLKPLNMFFFLRRK